MAALLKVVNPYSQNIVAELPFDEDAGLERKIQLAWDTWQRWRRVSLDDRIAIIRVGLERFRAIAQSDAIAADITRQMGKPIRQSRREVETFFERAEYMLSIAAQTLAPEILPEKPGFVRRIEHEPLGVVLNIAPWNYPLLTTVNVIIPALLAGNTVLIKHSAKTPLCGKHYEDAFGHLDPPNLVTTLIVSHADAARIIADKRIAHVAFTGSVEGGREIYQSAARRFIDVGLELGGKDPAYVADDADLDFAAENVVDGACYNAGQSCCAVERVYVHRDVYDVFMARAANVLQQYRMGDPMDESTTMGPLALPSAIDTLNRQVADAVRRGAKLLLGGHHPTVLPGTFFEPTLLADVPNDAEVMQEESFGPIVPVTPVTDDNDALQKMNDTRYGLTASVWTTSQNRAEWFARRLDAGTIYQNRCDYLDPALPWTGYRDSGKGSTLSKYGLHALTRRKSVHFRRGNGDGG